MNSLYHDDSYDPRELLDEYYADQRQQDNTTIIKDENGRVLGTAVKTVNRFNKAVYHGYWSDSPNVPIKDRRWNRDFSSVDEVTRYMRACKGAR